MRESIFKRFLGGLLALLVMSAGCAAEETAETVLARAQSACAAGDAVTVKAYARVVWVPMMQRPPGTPGPPNFSPPGAPAFGPPVRYQGLILRKKAPDDWYVASWSFGQNTGRMPGSMPPLPPSGFLLVKQGATPGKLTSFGNVHVKQAAQNNSLTDDEFAQTLRSRLLDGSSGFFALAPLLDAGGPGEPKGLFGLNDARLGGSEMWRGHGVYRLDGTGPMGGPLIAWIDQKSGLVLRTVMQQGNGGGSFTIMTETIYESAPGAKLGAGDFSPQPPPEAFAQRSDEQMGFGPADDLKQYADAPGSGPNGLFGSPVAPPAPVAAAPTVAEQQVLSPEQMEGIVLIDGDEGTATGFMTRIRGVDFIVTNQHVLGSNKKITIKNLRGDVVSVQGVFGAVGSDIALLRIAKTTGTLKVAEDVLKSVKIGDKIVVVGNRLGGGVATQTSGQVLGLGPTRIEVNANFEPGNSGSPIFSAGTNEVVGVATYAETRTVDVEENGGASRTDARRTQAEAKVEKRWFGYRLDGIAKWEAIDMARWHDQAERIGQFRDLSEALVSVIRMDFRAAASNARLAPLIADYDAKIEQVGNNRAGVADLVKDMMRTLRGIAEAGVNDFSNASYYDYYHTCLYWEESVPMQVDYRKEIIAVFKKYEANSSAYVSRMRSGANR